MRKVPAFKPDILVFLAALDLFTGQLLFCPVIRDWATWFSSDYYGHNELARNIFHKFDFTVYWELPPLQVPPAFSNHSVYSPFLHR
ncbi:MAG: hypothetical protein KGK03_09020 [Candidatus Omnitrophica bacterium]|nr:hypothetical protein [Candidatus Omnitrophota bacterium]MDE2223197.1 hypothetical protein [Candidatus Omnitrophota bacterium]